MTGRISWRVPALICATAVLVLLLVGMGAAERERTILGIPVISRSEYETYEAQGFTDETVNILYDYAPAAVDEQSHTIYIAQNVSRGMTLQDLQGGLFAADAGVSLYFVEQSADLAEAISQGQRFQLVARSVWGLCTSYDVVFTNLPVVSLTSVESTGADLETVFTGRFVLCDPKDEQLQAHRVTDCTAQWHYRGRSTITADKKSYRVSLKTKTGDKENHQLLDLGYDDDWIINAVVNDRTRLREHVISGLWQQMQETNAEAVNMSQGRFIEVVCDGTYQGVYLLQRKIDAKFLGMGEADFLFKGTGNGGPDGFWSALSPDDHGDSVSDADTYNMGVSFYEMGMAESLITENWIDMELLVQLGCLRDNMTYKNTYYWFRKQADGYQIQVIPWDVDMSFGFKWREDVGFVYDAETVVREMYHRREYQELLALYPDLEQRIALRWQELRESVLTEENFQKLVDTNMRQLDSADAIEREYEKWSYMYHQEDTVENMTAFWGKRLTVLDDYYAKFLK